MATQESAPGTEQEAKPIVAITNIAANMHDNGEATKAEEKVAELPAPKDDVSGDIGKRRHENEQKHAQQA